MSVVEAALDRRREGIDLLAEINLHPVVLELLERLAIPQSPCAIVDPAAAKVRDLNFKYLAEGKGATDTARLGPHGITIVAPNRAGEGVTGVFPRIYGKAI